MFRLLTATIAASAVLAPAAVAAHAPGDNVAPTRQASVSSATVDQLDARLGPKYVVSPTAKAPLAAVVQSRDTHRWIYPIVLVALVAGLVALRVRRVGKPNVATAVPTRNL